MAVVAYSFNPKAKYDFRHCMFVYGWERSNLSFLPKSIVVPYSGGASYSPWHVTDSKSHHWINRALIFCQRLQKRISSAPWCTIIWDFLPCVDWHSVGSLPSILPFIKKSSIAPKEIAIGFSPRGRGCCRVKSLFLLHRIYHPDVGRLVKLSPKAWNASLLKCLLERGGAMGGLLLFRFPGCLKNSSPYIRLLYSK